MATTKTLAPTNQQITIAAFSGEKPDQRQIADAESKMADAINAVNSQLTTIAGNNGRVRIKSNLTEFTVDLTQFGSYSPSEYQGFFIITRYGLFYMIHYVQDNTQIATCETIQGGHTCTPTMSNDGKSVTLTFSRQMFGGITMYG